MNNMRKQFGRQRTQAAKRGIPFLLSFEEWLQIWIESGHLQERGRRKHQYVMARLGDAGAYEVGNVKIITAHENKLEQRHPWIGRRHSAETRKKISAGKIGNKNGRGNKGRTFSPATIEKMRLARIGQKRDPETGAYTT